MYKLYKMFSSKAKQIARDKEKESGGGLAGGVRRESSMSQGRESIEEQFAPLQLSSKIQNSIKQFKVQCTCGMTWVPTNLEIGIVIGWYMGLPSTLCR